MRNPNGNALAMRDPALAALMGAIPGSDFGLENEYSGGGHNAGSSDDEFGFEFGFDLGALTSPGGGASMLSNPGVQALNGGQMANYHAAVAQAAAAQGNPAAAATALQTSQLWAQQAQGAAQTSRRRSLIEPNAGSDVKIERYTFALNATIPHLGTTAALSGSGAPQVNLRPQRVTCNAAIPGFVTLSNLSVANIGIIVGGTVDAYQFGANAVGQHLDMPTLSPANAASFTGSYTGVTPLEYGSSTAAYVFCVGLTGPASMSA